ncbi:IPTL-CTERM sorting domain-containing protein [Paracidovorax anthurii]|uniref:Putative secreted protein (IPTL-CTERM system target) n=1 Tax=Paracidovorax anthurii TaxID=78229 RepID=A0A328YW53_9BURK|nr:IPTL-CTERM sorting domain-containing protein [Paracidovorax anthurii]RAR77065.1 putative secreted protein (IPTL-CTERM system target) [Paracidovorax anthurii]
MTALPSQSQAIRRASHLPQSRVRAVDDARKIHQILGWPHRWLLALCLLCAAWAASPALAQGAMPTLLGEPVSQVMAGSSSTCVLTTAGAVRCWGSNSSGQLGDGTTTQRNTPVAVSGLGSGVAAIVGGSAHTCALTTAGAVQCWGANDFGQLGDGVSALLSNTAVAVSGLGSGVAAIAAGLNHTCVLTTAGAVQCWGNNINGQLGDGTTTRRTTPVTVSGLGSGVAAIAAGSSHTCAVTMAGAVRCWGDNTNGRLGDGSSTQSLIPVAVSGLGSGATAIAAGNAHTCALTTAGAVRCWGANSNGQAGDGTISIQRNTPTAVSGLGSGVAAISARNSHTCAVTVAGAVLCWGNNPDGRLGDGSTTQSATPVAVSGLGAGVAAVSAGTSHSCALTTAGAVRCWGLNSNGQLGDGTTTQRTTPVAVSGLGAGVVAIGPGANHTCALTTAGGVLCWGSNALGRLGDGTTTDSLAPVAVSGLGSGVVAIGSGNFHTCALTTAGAVLCWGSNSNGQVGNGVFSIQETTPVAVSGLGSGVTAIAVGNFHTCALTTAGAVLCWGANFDGRVGDGSTTNRNSPTPVSGLGAGVAAIAAGDHTCAVTTAGAVLCWGGNTYGQLGDGTTTQRSTPVAVSGLGFGVAAVAPGEQHTCALTTAGAVQCWGNNSQLQLGDGTNTQRTTPVAVGGLGGSGVAALGAGSYHNCALTTAGALLCWGSGGNGRLGNGMNGSAASRSTPEAVIGLDSGVASMAMGNSYTCALTTAGVLRCWGFNGGVGQLGDGTITDRFTPTAIRIGQSIAFTPGNVGTPLRSLALGISASLSATSSGGGSQPITYGTWTPGSCTVNGSTVTPTASAAPGNLCGLIASRAAEGSAAASTAAAPQQMRLLTLTKAAPAVSLTSGGNPSAFGSSVVLTATFANAANATGNVVFSSGSITLCTVPVSAGVANCQVSGLSVGPYTFVAAYAGDANNDAATSNTLLQTVGAGAFTLPGTAGTAMVNVSGPADCAIRAPQFSAAPPTGTPVPERTTFPLGVFSFTATGTGCAGAALNVRIDYPAGALAGMLPRKFGPNAPGATPAWFAHGTITGDSVSYGVTDNGIGDNDTTVGEIADPFALMLVTVDPTPVPALNPWGLILMSLMAAGLGMLAVRRRY